MTRYWLIALLPLSLCTAAREAKPVEGSIEITFQTQAYKGKYSPRHVLAVWVVDDKDEHVATLAVYGKKYAKRLGRWRKAFGKARPDAVTGATLRTHEALTVVWDGTDADGKKVPDGDYKIRFEYTETNRAGPAFQIPVTKGAVPGEEKVKGSKFFSDITVRTVGAEPAKR